MHEVSIARSIVTAVLAAVGAEAVESVEAQVGALSGVAPSSLQLGWEVATAGTPLQGASLRVVSVPTSVYCATCEKVVEPDVGLCCPECGELSADVRSGHELDVRSVRLRAADPGGGVP